MVKSLPKNPSIIETADDGPEERGVNDVAAIHVTLGYLMKECELMALDHVAAAIQQARRLTWQAVQNQQADASH